MRNMKKFIKEFRDFAVKGNVIDLAVGVVIGGAFGKIVTSLVNDVIMPLIGLVLGRINFVSLKWVIAKETDSTPALTLNYGAFIQSIVDFTFITLSIFLFIKLINKVRAKAEEVFVKKKEEEENQEKVVQPETERLLTEIRDLLKEKDNAE